MLVSVIIPVYNREHLLSETLHSVKAQTYRPLEIIIVDNDSSDGSSDVAHDFAAKENEESFSIRVIKESHRGASACRNAGIKAAKGKWLCFFDSDDIMSKSFVYDAVKTLSDDTQLVVGATRLWNGDTLRNRVFLFNNSADTQILTGGIATQSFIIRQDFLCSVGGWNENLLRWNDWELGVRLSLASPHIKWLRERAYHRIRVHNKSITGTNFSHSGTELLAACRAVQQDIKAISEKNKYKEARCHRAFVALIFRVYILAGCFRKEKALQLAAEAQAYAKELAHSCVMRIAGRLIMYYVACGGRGAWRPALLLCRLL